MGNEAVKGDRIKRNVNVIKQLQGMTEEDLDTFMEEFLKGLDHWNFSMDRLAIFMQLLIQMDPHLAERFMKEMAEKEDNDHFVER